MDINNNDIVNRCQEFRGDPNRVRVLKPKLAQLSRMKFYIISMRFLLTFIILAGVPFGYVYTASARWVDGESTSAMPLAGNSPVPPDANPGDENWAAGFGLPGGDGDVYALAVDGAGVLYAGGAFTTADGMTVNHVAMWDGASWSALCNGTDCGMNDVVNSLAVDGAGNLYAGGEFTTAGGGSVNYVAIWDGMNWSALCSGGRCGMNKAVNALTVDSAGNLYAGGSFANAGDVSANYVAMWDGVSWSALCAGDKCGMNNYVNALAVDSAGNLYAGGFFVRAGGVNVYRVAMWDGTSWSALCNVSDCGMDPEIYTLAVDGADRLYAGGPFDTAGGVTVNHVAMWDGASWSGLCSGTDCGMDGDVHAVAFDSAGNLYAGGNFSLAGGSPVNNIAKWNGTSWIDMGAGVDDVTYALQFEYSGNFFSGGAFGTAGTGASPYIAAWTAAVGMGSLQSGQAYDFYTGNLPVTVSVNTLGTLESISIQRFNKDHPNASPPIQTGYYWYIHGTDSSGVPAAGFYVDLTLPTTFTAGSSYGVCHYDSVTVSWDCALTSYATQSVTRSGISAFSEWAVGHGVNPQPPNLSISRIVTDIELTWLHASAGVDHFEVWRATNLPYFAPGDPGSTKKADLSTDPSQSYVYTDTTSAIGDTINNSFYKVRAIYVSGSYADSDPVAEFDFPIQPGVPGSPSWTSIAAPLDIGPLSADGLASYIDPSGSIKRVGKWDTATSTWVYRIVGSPFPPSDYPVNPGDALMVYAESTAPTSFTWVGSVPDVGSVTYNLSPNQWIFLTVPLDQDLAVIPTADQFAAGIQAGGSAMGMRVGKWDNATQTWIYRIVGSPFPPGDYSINLGYPYFVLTNSSTPPQWP